MAYIRKRVNFKKTQGANSNYSESMHLLLEEKEYAGVAKMSKQNIQTIKKLNLTEYN